jgi:ABC-type branched-subunit amino acid transport system substrate-binding protein
MAVACGLAACGSSDDTTTTSTPAAATGASSATTASKPTGAPIKILVDTAVDQPYGSFPGVVGGANAAAKAINDAGGINGRPIETIACNNKADPNAAAGCMREAIKNDAVAVVGTELYGAALYPVLQKAGIPASFTPLTAIDLQSPVNHPITGATWTEWVGVGRAAADAGAKTLAIAAVQIPGMDVVLDNVNAVAKSAGVEVVKTIPVPATATTFAATAKQLQSTGADAVALILSVPQSGSLIQAAQQLNYRPKWVISFGGHSVQSLKSLSQLAPDNLVAAATLPPASASDEFAGIKQFNEEMDAAFAAGDDNAKPDNREENAVYTWAFVHAVGQLAESIDGDVNAASITKALESPDSTVTIPGLLTWKPGSPGAPGYPGLKDDAPMYDGPVENGEFKPSSDKPIPAVEGVTLTK